MSWHYFCVLHFCLYLCFTFLCLPVYCKMFQCLAVEYRSLSRNGPECNGSGASDQPRTGQKLSQRTQVSDKRKHKGWTLDTGVGGVQVIIHQRRGAHRATIWIGEGNKRNKSGNTGNRERGGGNTTKETYSRQRRQMTKRPRGCLISCS